MKHCKGCSHPTICNTMGCGAEEHRANKAKAAEPSYAELKAQRDELLEALKACHLELYYCNQQLCAEGCQEGSSVKSALAAGATAIAKAEGKEGGAA